MLYTPDSVTIDGMVPAIRSAGGKGSGLYWLKANGFPSPSTWVLSTAAFDFMIKHSRMQDVVQSIDQATAVSLDWAGAQRVLDDLEPQRQALVYTLEQKAWPAELHALLLRLPHHNLWAVRSSATVEDTEMHSFAGQFRSKLGVPARIDDIERAVREIWISVFKREVLAYRAQFATPMPRMAVILQPMAPITAHERSGVVFSRSPVPTMPGVFIQATFGAGRAVVDGRGGDIYTIQDQQVTFHPMAPPDITVCGPAGGEISAPTPPGAALSQAEASQLAADVLVMAERWGKPVNIEFVWYAQEKSPVYVQVRPITG